MCMAEFTNNLYISFTYKIIVLRTDQLLRPCASIFNSFGAIGDYSRPQVDITSLMTSIRLHLKVVSLNHYTVNRVSIESIMEWGSFRGFPKFLFVFLALYFVKFAMIFWYL